MFVFVIARFCCAGRTGIPNHESPQQLEGASACGAFTRKERYSPRTHTKTTMDICKALVMH